MHALNLQPGAIFVASIPLTWVLCLWTADNEFVFNTLTRYYCHACIELRQPGAIFVASIPLIWVVRLWAANNQFVFNTLTRYYCYVCIEFAARCHLCSIHPVNLGAARLWAADNQTHLVTYYYAHSGRHHMHSALAHLHHVCSINLIDLPIWKSVEWRYGLAEIFEWWGQAWNWSMKWNELRILYGRLPCSFPAVTNTTSEGAM